MPDQLTPTDHTPAPTPAEIVRVMMNDRLRASGDDIVCIEANERRWGRTRSPWPRINRSISRIYGVTLSDLSLAAHVVRFLNSDPTDDEISTVISSPDYPLLLHAYRGRGQQTGAESLRDSVNGLWEVCVREMDMNLGDMYLAVRVLRHLSAERRRAGKQEVENG